MGFGHSLFKFFCLLFQKIVAFLIVRHLHLVPLHDSLQAVTRGIDYDVIVIVTLHLSCSLTALRAIGRIEGEFTEAVHGDSQLHL